MPDINSIPALPYATPRHISTTQQQQPGAAPSSQSQQHTGPSTAASPELNILPSNQQTYHQRALSTSLPSPPFPASSSNPTLPMAMPPPPAPVTRPDPAETGPGPIRHPRPLTAAELHQQLEQEQELLVCSLRFCCAPTTTWFPSKKWTDLGIACLCTGQPTHSRPHYPACTAELLGGLQHLVAIGICVHKPGPDLVCRYPHIGAWLPPPDHQLR